MMARLAERHRQTVLPYQQVAGPFIGHREIALPARIGEIGFGQARHVRDARLMQR
jgi:hypothetical protein